MHSANQPSICVGSAPVRRAVLHGLALLLLLLLLAPTDASAQLRGLGGTSPLGNVGGLGGLGGIGGTSSIGVPNIGNVPQSLSGSSNQIIGPALNIPIGEPSLPRTDTITNTINRAAGNALSLPGRATNQLGNTLKNQRPRNAANPRGQSGAPPRGERRFVRDEVMLRLPSNLSERALDGLARRHGLSRLESQRVELTGITFHRWRITGGQSVSDTIRALEADTGVSAAQPNYLFTLAQSEMQGLARGQRVTQYALAKLKLPQAHRLATGDHVLIAVIDSRIDINHPEIEGYVAASYDALNSKEPPHAHGTAMAGAIIAHAQLIGVAPSARILAIRAFGGSGNAEGNTLALLRAIDWAVAHGARIINMSFTGPHDPEIARTLALARKKGVVLVAAAGNAGAKSPPLFPASDANVIAVTATDADDRLFAQANRGKHIALAAPGVEILAPLPGALYQASTGTSIAAAEVSGVAALLIERKRDLTPDALRAVLTSTATDLGPKGRDEQFGAGLANAYRAIQALDAIAARGAPASTTAAAR